jgi:uncharacterized protein with PIN domain
MKFLFDEMLKRLASWCRIFGIYSEFFEGKSDSELLEYAREHELIFVTRDVQLSERCLKQEVRCILLKSTDIEEQLKQVVKETGVEIGLNTRCAMCNGELEKTERNDDVPPKVRATEFWKCKSCSKVFWEGSHWKNIRKLLLSLEE